MVKLRPVLFGLLALFSLSIAEAQIKISSLPTGSTLAGTELIPMVQSSATVTTTPAAIYSFVNPYVIPLQTGNSGKLLSTNGTSTFWEPYLQVSPTQILGTGPQGGLTDMTPDAGTFTGTLTGMTTTVTGTVTWRRMGNLVVLASGNAAFFGTSNATTFSLTGLPSYLQPVLTQNIPCSLEDNGNNTAGMASITSGSGTIVFSRSLVSGTSVIYSSGSFTASGNKGFNFTVIGPYILN